jgi:hypothetical protein
MDHAITATPTETVPDRAQPSLYPIRGGDTEGLMAKLTAARYRWAKVSGKAPRAPRLGEPGVPPAFHRETALEHGPIMGRLRQPLNSGERLGKMGNRLWKSPRVTKLYGAAGRLDLLKQLFGRK